MHVTHYYYTNKGHLINKYVENVVFQQFRSDLRVCKLQFVLNFKSLNVINLEKQSGA